MSFFGQETFFCASEVRASAKKVSRPKANVICRQIRDFFGQILPPTARNPKFSKSGKKVKPDKRVKSDKNNSKQGFTHRKVYEFRSYN